MRAHWQDADETKPDTSDAYLQVSGGISADVTWAKKDRMWVPSIMKIPLPRSYARASKAEAEQVAVEQLREHLEIALQKLLD